MLHVIVGSTLSSTVHDCYSTSSVEFVRLDITVRVIHMLRVCRYEITSTESRCGMFYSVSVTCIEHVAGSYAGQYCV